MPAYGRECSQDEDCKQRSTHWGYQHRGVQEPNNSADAPCRSERFRPWHGLSLIPDSCRKAAAMPRFRADSRFELPPASLPALQEWQTKQVEHLGLTEGFNTCSRAGISLASTLASRLNLAVWGVSFLSSRDLFQATRKTKCLRNPDAHNRTTGFGAARRSLRTTVSLNPTRNRVCLSAIPWPASQPCRYLDPRCPGRTCTSAWPAHAGLSAVR